MTYVDKQNAWYAISGQQPQYVFAVMWLLLCLDNANRKYGTFYATDEQIRERILGLSKVQVTNAKRILKEMGVIDYETDSDAPRKGTRYVITLGAKLGQNKGKTRVKSIEESRHYAAPDTPKNKSKSIEKEKKYKRKEKPEEHEESAQVEPDLSEYLAEIEKPEKHEETAQDEPDLSAYLAGNEKGGKKNEGNGESPGDDVGGDDSDGRGLGRDSVPCAEAEPGGIESAENASGADGFTGRRKPPDGLWELAGTTAASPSSRTSPTPSEVFAGSEADMRGIPPRRRAG